MPSLIIILDGMQDNAYEELGGLTPYEKGRGESFLELESASKRGRFITTPDGFEPDTQTCVLYLLGVKPEDIPHGRSYIEALALGVDIGDDDIIMRCNFVKLDDNGRLAIPCCSAPDGVAAALRAEVAREGSRVIPVGSYKSLQIINGGAKYIESLETSMPHQHQGEPFEKLLPRGNALARSLAAFSRRMYDRYAPFTVLNWAPAVKRPLPLFSKLHPGMSGAMVSKTDAPIGTAVAMGMECPPIPTATGDTDTDLAAKVSATLGLLKKHDFVMLHIGGPDEATHRQNPVEKAEFIAKLDKEMMKPILEACEPGTKIIVTCDHAGICSTAGHTVDPVEFFLYEKGRVLEGDFGLLDGGVSVSLL